MLVYVLMEAAVIFGGLFLLNCSPPNSNIQKLNSKVYFFIVFLMMFLLSALRGDFTADYIGYEQIYERYYSHSLFDILALGFDSYPELGYLLLQYFVKEIFGNVIFLFVVTSFIIVSINLSEIKKWFGYNWLPVLLFLDLGTFYTSFNVTRQILAVSMMVLGSRYIYDKKPVKYFLMVFVAMLFHSSAFIMIPAYFFFNFKQKKGRLFLYIIGGAAIFVMLPLLLRLVQQYLWSGYNTESLLQSGYNYKNIVAPLILSLPPIIIYNCSSRDSLESMDRVESIWLNGTYMYLFFSLLGCQVALASRFASFFSLFAVFAFARSFTRIKSNILRFVATSAAVALVVLFNFVVKYGSALDPFYFIWQR